ncbi:MAG: carbon monoxide dehydrogenase [Gammaproteobacteria bacterium]|nr:carbon monoxide dehydrogenase [Gammaproteobacteria bacterium]
MYNFDINQPASVAEASTALSSGGNALAGGQSLLPTMKLRLADPGSLVALSGIAELRGITVTGDTVTLGAMTTHAEVAASAAVRAAIPALCDLAGRIGDPAVRNRGTIGGSLANSDPAADYPAAVLGLGATINTSSRSIAADDYFKGLFETALEDGEIITSVSFPIPSKAGYAKFPQPASRFALVGVFAAATGGGARVAVTGAGACAFRQGDMEAALDGNWSGDAVASVSVSADGLNSDLHGSARYRAHLISVMAERAVQAAG